MAHPIDYVLVCAHCGKPLIVRAVPKQDAHRPAEETR